MAYLDDLEDIRDNIATMVKTETALMVTNGPRPSYTIDGRSVSWTEWLKAMMETLAKLDDQIAAASNISDPYEHIQRGYT